MIATIMFKRFFSLLAIGTPYLTEIEHISHTLAAHTIRTLPAAEAHDVSVCLCVSVYVDIFLCGLPNSVH